MSDETMKDRERAAFDPVVLAVAESLSDANQPGNIEAQIRHLMNCVRDDVLAHDGKIAGRSELAKNRLKVLIGLAVKDARAASQATVKGDEREPTREVIEPLKEPVYIRKAMLAGRNARVVLSGGAGPQCAVFLVNIQITSWTEAKEWAEGYAQGFNQAAAWMQDAILSRAAASLVGAPELEKKDRTIAFLRGQNRRIIDTAEDLRKRNLERIAELESTAAPQAGALWSTDAARDVLAERARQASEEGWTTAHDDQNDLGQMASAAACYALTHRWTRIDAPPPHWPGDWARAWWKPTTPRRDLVKAGALIIAEIERLDRTGGNA